MSPRGVFSKETMRALSNYINDSIAELRQVRWPTRQQAIRLSIITIIFTAACAGIFGTVDWALSQLVLVILPF